MKKKELVNAVSLKLGITKKLTGEVIDALVTATEEALANGEEVGITGFGKLIPYTRSERTCINFKDGSEMFVPAKTSVKFKASDYLKEKVNL